MRIFPLRALSSVSFVHVIRKPDNRLSKQAGSLEFNSLSFSALLSFSVSMVRIKTFCRKYQRLIFELSLAPST